MFSGTTMKDMEITKGEVEPGERGGNGWGWGQRSGENGRKLCLNNKFKKIK